MCAVCVADVGTWEWRRRWLFIDDSPVLALALALVCEALTADGGWRSRSSRRRASRRRRSERLDGGAPLDVVGEGGWDMAWGKADGTLSVLCPLVNGRSRRKRGLGRGVGAAALRRGRGVRGAWGCGAEEDDEADDGVSDDDKEKDDADDAAGGVDDDGRIEAACVCVCAKYQ